MKVQQLKGEIEGQVFDDEETLQQVQTDFGRIVQKTPRLVVLPASPQDVQKVVRMAWQEGWPVATRGAAHSQSGQSLSQDGILIDMSGLNRVEKVEGDSVWAEAGVQWSELVEKLGPAGLVPPVLTNNLNVTVGGTLAMAGLGVASHRYGTQADNIEELEVVTGEGHLVRCSPSENRDLFDCTRCGLGQFALITRARLKLRRFAPRVRTFFLLYDNLEVLLRDQQQLMAEGRFDFIESWCVPCPQGLRQWGESRVPFAEWFYPLHLTLEYADEAPGEEISLAGLNYYRKVHVEDLSFLEFGRRLEPVFALWKQSGAWELAHPWMECILPWEAAPSYIQGVLKNFPPNLLMGGHVLLWPCRGETSRAPLFKHPGGEFVMGFGILPAVPRQWLPLALALLNKASDLCMQVGGKRYLSGWIDFDVTRWKSHFGETWSRVLEWKRFYDPKGILNPGFIKYSEQSQ